jgi:hypothetical protein
MAGNQVQQTEEPTMQSMNESSTAIKHEVVAEEFSQILLFMQTGHQQGYTAHEVESGLWQRLLKLGHSLYQGWLDLFGDGDAGDRIVLEDGREVGRLEDLHRREIQNVFGVFALMRAVYGTREGQRIEAVPLDARLQLPQGKNSYLLQDWDQELAVQMPYASVTATLGRILGLSQSVHTLERNQREMATAAEDFWTNQPTPPAEQEGEILVCTADGKGVPMRGGAKAPAGIEPPATGGARPGTKKMALVGATYTVAPFTRTPEEVLEALFREAPASEPLPARPRPCFKYVRAALQRDDQDCTEPQVQAIFGWMAEQVARRNPDGKKPVILLMDGQDSLWKAGWDYLPEELAEVTEILDLLHALGYLWEAAHLFHPKDSEAASDFVKAQARRILHGEIAAVIHSLRWLGTHHNLKGKRRRALERICGYFHNNAHRMAYDAYLEHGFPIASGVIEGACRCVIKDRMERSGMRWVMSGAHAMLDMRCIYLSGLWEEFTAFRIQRESRRLYSGYAANDPDFRTPLAA